MRLLIDMDMDNAAFDDGVGGRGTEAARILRRLANQIEGVKLMDGDTYCLMDYNGNSVGNAVVTAQKRREKPGPKRK